PHVSGGQGLSRVAVVEQDDGGAAAAGRLDRRSDGFDHEPARTDAVPQVRLDEGGLDLVLERGVTGDDPTQDGRRTFPGRGQLLLPDGDRLTHARGGRPAL